MATIKFVTKGSSANARVTVLLNGEKVGSGDKREASAIAKANGSKNVAPFELSFDGGTGRSIAGFDKKLKTSNTIELFNRGKVIGTATAPDADKLIITVKKNGFIGTIMGKPFVISVKTK